MKKQSGKKEMPKTYKGEPTKLGGGGRFEMMKDKIMATGKSAASAEAITANIGRKKLGKEKFQKLATAGRKKK
jgi:hypothetical protein